MQAQRPGLAQRPSAVSTRLRGPSPSPDHEDEDSSSTLHEDHDSASPTGDDAKILSTFRKVDEDGSGYISAEELQNALGVGDWPSFEIDTVKLLMNLFDTNRNGTIDINEFHGLWKYIEHWKLVFHHFDQNHNGAIDGDELKTALEQFDYKLSEPLQDLLQRKYDVNWASGYASPAGHVAPSGISFDRFMRACVVVKQLKESFDELERDAYGHVKIDYDTFLRMVFKLP